MGNRSLSKGATLTAAEECTSAEAKSPQLYLLMEYRPPSAGGARFSLAGIDEVRLGRGDERRVCRDGSTLRIEIPDERISLQHAQLVRLCRKLT